MSTKMPGLHRPGPARSAAGPSPEPSPPKTPNGSAPTSTPTATCASSSPNSKPSPSSSPGNPGHHTPSREISPPNAGSAHRKPAKTTGQRVLSVTHREIAGQGSRPISRSSPWEPCGEPNCRLPVWLRRSPAATAKTASISTTRATAGTAAHHKTCPGRWRGVVSLGFDVGGKRIRKKVSGQTRTEVQDKLKALHSELDAGVRTVQGYTVESAITDWPAEGLPGRAAETVEVYRDALRPVLAVIGRIPLRDLTVQDVRDHKLVCAPSRAGRR